MENTNAVIETLDDVSKRTSLCVKSLELCETLLRNYIDRLECKKDVPPEIPPALQAVLSLLQNTQQELFVIGDIVTGCHIDLLRKS